MGLTPSHARKAWRPAPRGRSPSESHTGPSRTVLVAARSLGTHASAGGRRRRLVEAILAAIGGVDVEQADAGGFAVPKNLDCVAVDDGDDDEGCESQVGVSVGVC